MNDKRLSNFFLYLLKSFNKKKIMMETLSILKVLSFAFVQTFVIRLFDLYFFFVIRLNTMK